MTTDRELLELAAKAAGINGAWHCDGFDTETSPDALKPRYWNPLLDDGDALRLAVKLGIDFYEGDDDGPASYAGYFVRGIARQRFATERHNSDQYAATRRAIVRAAAEVGKGMLSRDEFVLMFPGRFEPEEVERARAAVAIGRSIQ